MQIRDNNATGFDSVIEPSMVNVIQQTGKEEPALEELSVTPSTSKQLKTPTTGKVGFSRVLVSAVTSDIDANILPENIKAGVTILGVEGTYTGGEE